MLLEWMFHYNNIIARCFADIKFYWTRYFSIAFYKFYVTYMLAFMLLMRNTSLFYGFEYIQRSTTLGYVYLYIMVVCYIFNVVFLLFHGMY